MKSILFAVGFVLGQLGACAVVVLLGGTLLPDRERNAGALRGALELAFGLALIALAALVRRRPTEPSQPRSDGLLARLRTLGTLTAIVAGLALGVGGPKRLVLTALAGTSIAAAGAQGADAVALVVTYAVAATLLVWGPVVAFAFAGDRVAAWLDATQRSLARHERTIAFYSLLGVGVAAIAHGLSLVSRA